MPDLTIMRKNLSKHRLRQRDRDGVVQDMLREAVLTLYSSSDQYEDTGEYDEEHESHLRQELQTWASYAEAGPTYDPDGKYLCGSCDMRKEPKDCMRVEGPISMTGGSCRLFTLGEKPESDPSMPHKLTQIQASYSERPHVKGFGCKRCDFGSEAKEPDSQGRPSWCSFWGIHVTPTACCFRNENKDDVVPNPGE